MDPQQVTDMLQQLQDQQVLLQAQAQQLNALHVLISNQPPAIVLPAQPTPPVFALTPALAQMGIINYTDTSGIKLCKSIITPLMMLYDGTASKKMATWTNHLTKDCKLKKHKAERKANWDKKKQEGQVTALQVTKALTTIAEGSGLDNDYEDQE
jgi:endonuclease/exonuclease/phosphatase (EEP) superfamily protein YafD